MAHSGAEAQAAYAARRPTLVLLDLTLPDVEGLEIIERIRARADTPIIVLSARDAAQDKVDALDLGADDYLASPWPCRAARAHALALRRVADVRPRAPSIVAATSRRLRAAAGDVAGRSVELTPAEYGLLRVFIATRTRCSPVGCCSRKCGGPSTARRDTTCTSTSPAFAASSKNRILSVPAT